MDTNTNDYILVLEDKESKKLSVVSSVDAEGKVQTVEPLDVHSGQFMKFSENDSIFKNFMENFTRQFNDPSRTVHIPEHTRSLSGGLLGHKIMP